MFFGRVEFGGKGGVAFELGVGLVEVVDLVEESGPVVWFGWNWVYNGV